MAMLTSLKKPAPLSQKQKKMMFYTLFLIVAAFVLFNPYLAHAKDIFDGAKAQITESTNSDSSLWFAVTVVGFAAAALTGFLTKNWPLAIGGFFAGMIFMRVAASTIGLA